MRIISRLAPIVTIGMLMSGALHAQHTFSIVAVDPATGEVGSAGASCVPFNANIISGVYPGIGAINTQAQYDFANQSYAADLLRDGQTARATIDSLITHDVAANPGVRQYGAVTLAGPDRSAAYTGTNCMDYKGHRTGLTYSIQGNILLGPQILDSMEARFLRATGPLADRLMAALQGANVIGADSRCAPNSSSHSAFIRLARGTDSEDSLSLDISVALGTASTAEPIDTLQKLYDAWKGSSAGVERHATNGSEMGASLTVSPNPAAPTSTAHLVLSERSDIAVTLHDALGNLRRAVMTGRYEPGAYELPLPTSGLPSGTYFCSVTIGVRVLTRKIVVL